MANYSSILAQKSPWIQEPDGLQSMVSQRVGHNWVTNTYIWVLYIYMYIYCLIQLFTCWISISLYKLGHLCHKDFLYVKDSQTFFFESPYPSQCLAYNRCLVRIQERDVHVCGWIDGWMDWCRYHCHEVSSWLKSAHWWHADGSSLFPTYLPKSTYQSNCPPKHCTIHARKNLTETNRAIYDFDKKPNREVQILTETPSMRLQT